MGRCTGFQDQEAKLRRRPMSQRRSDQLHRLRSSEIYRINRLARVSVWNNAREAHQRIQF